MTRGRQICRSALLTPTVIRQDGVVKRVEYLGPPLTRATAANVLDDQGVARSSYSLTGAKIFEGFVMRQTPDSWLVFYTERGRDEGKVVHATEADACRDLVERL